MAVAFKAKGGGAFATASASTLTLQTTAHTANFDVGDLVLICIATDNLTVSTPTFTCTDTGGNTYSSIVLKGNNGTGAATGCIGAILATKVTTQVVAGLNTHTLTLSGAVTAKSVRIYSFTGVEITTRSTPVSSSGSSGTSTSGASGTVNAGDLVVGLIAIETRGVVTQDADTTNGAWVALDALANTGSGGDAAAMTISTMYKIPSASGAQTYDNTHTTLDWAGMVAVFQATAVAAITQAAYQFFDETGTESGATSLAAQNTAVIGNLTNGDGFGLVRIRLQTTNAVAVPATDDFTLQWEKNASGSWTNVGTGAVIGFNAPSLTEGQATTNRLTGGTGTFVAGKISEDGVADDMGWSASNYTEVVYSVKLLAAQFSNGDVLRFRVVKNGSTGDMTYTQTPTVNIVAGVAMAPTMYPRIPT